MRGQERSRYTPREANQEEIKLVFTSLLRAMEQQKELSSGMVVCKLLLTTGDGYAVYNRLPNYETSGLFIIETSVRDRNLEVLSRLDYFFAEENNQVIVTPQVSSVQESQGYGSGLMLLMNDVMPYAIDNNPHIRDRHVEVVLKDVSEGYLADNPQKGIVKDREAWTSHFAKKLGFVKKVQDDNRAPVWTKVYQEGRLH